MKNESIAISYCINIPEDVTNSQAFICVFGIDAWKQMIEFSKVNDQFREFWNAPYKAESEECYVRKSNKPLYARNNDYDGK